MAINKNHEFEELDGIKCGIVEKNVSVWIAQRNGRAKDGNDQTQTGLLKMLNMSGTGNFSKNNLELGIVPVTISYEYEPCDALKVQELHLSSLHSKYLKAPGEDLNSIVTGITQQKGRIHFSVGTPIIDELNQLEKIDNDNDKIKQLAALIDRQIYTNYMLWPVNYIAADLLENNNQYLTKYTLSEKQDFINYVNAKVSKMDGEREALINLFIKMYASPVKNSSLQTVQV